MNDPDNYQTTTPANCPALMPSLPTFFNLNALMALSILRIRARLSKKRIEARTDCQGLA
jgi:hypothetical protein